MYFQCIFRRGRAARAPRSGPPRKGGACIFGEFSVYFRCIFGEFSVYERGCDFSFSSSHTSLSPFFVAHKERRCHFRRRRIRDARCTLLLRPTRRAILPFLLGFERVVDLVSGIWTFSRGWLWQCREWLMQCRSVVESQRTHTVLQKLELSKGLFTESWTLWNTRPVCDFGP